jgi:hypothetical protein
MKDQRSFYVYVHDDLSQDPDWKKVGKSMTPHSAVRARQKYCSKKVSLNHLYFGDPAHIDFLEKEFKDKFKSKSGSVINEEEISCQTEMFKMLETDIVIALNDIIETNALNVTKLELDHLYSAANQHECPLKIPNEDKSYDHCRELVITHWGKCSDHKISKANHQFTKSGLFTVDDSGIVGFMTFSDKFEELVER